MSIFLANVNVYVIIDLAARKGSFIMFNNLPTLDLHGEYRDSARILITEFIDDSYKLGYDKVVIVHGIGKGILKDEVKKCLKKNKKVAKFYIDFFNVGSTIVELNKKS